MATSTLSGSAYIMLTPTSMTDGVKPPVPASDLVARKWAATKRKHNRDLKEHVARAASFKEPDPEDDLEPTDTDRSSELDAVTADSRASSKSGGGDDDGENNGSDMDDADGELSVFPTYVCELHDPKPILIAEHIQYNRVDIAPFDPPSSAKDSGSGGAAKKKTRYVGSHSDTLFQYEISVGPMQEIFECTPAQVLEVYKALSKDASIAEQLRFLETNYFRDGLLGSLKRLYVSRDKLSEEMIEVLEAISDVDAVLSHASYLELIGATKGSVVLREIRNLLQHHTRTPRSDPSSTCMCAAYHKSVDRFGAFYKEQAASIGHPERFSTVASESLMWSRGVLSFYTDTVYVLDKREFRPTRGLKKCAIYGFGRRKLFEIVRTSRKEWSVRHFHYGELYTLRVDRYLYGMKTRHMVAIKRKVPDLQHGGLRQENVCFVKKSKTHGYRCLLMGEVISRGKVTTSISIEHPKSPDGDPHYHYVTMSEISGAAREAVCSSTLSVPADYHKHLQRLHVCGGSDVVAFLAIAASYDILVGAITYWMEKKY